MPHGELKAACDALNAMAAEALVTCPAAAQPAATEAAAATEATGASEG